jgi:hypothetical protein
MHKANSMNEVRGTLQGGNALGETIKNDR